MKGDRILIKNTDKKLGLVNGDFATVMHASKERFVISMEKIGDAKSNITNDNSKVVEFNPSTYNGFRHGYATTVFKAQAASILNVFVFHDGFAGIRNSYVALSRNVKDLNLYINKQATKSMNHLVKQLGHDPEIGSSLSYFTKQDLLNKEVMAGTQQERGILSSMLSNAVDFTKNKITTFSDKHFVDNAYYKYEAPKFTKEVVENVLDIVAEELEVEAIGSEIVLEERAVVGGHSNQLTATSNNANKNGTNTNNVKQTAKERFYAKADRSRNATNDLARKAQWNMESEHLRSEVKFKTEAIARDLLGEPNKHLSNGKTLCFGEHGKIAVRISGERMGSWFDFSSDKGGDMFALVQDRQGCDFKGAAEYLRQSVGIEASSGTNLQLVHDHSNRDLTEKHIKEKIEEERVAKAKAEQVEKLHSRAKDIGDKSLAYKYLTEHRGLDLTKTNYTNRLSNDLKTTGVYTTSGKDSSEKGKYLPTLVAFARDTEGNITGGQQIFLDKASANKADIAIPKKSFGKIAGSFVNVSNINSADNEQKLGKNIVNSQKDKVTIIAEGLETAMSVDQSLSEHSEKNTFLGKTLCSLGISNIKNYQPNTGEKIIIAADNDGVDSNTRKTIENAKLALEQKGAFVEIVKPSKEGDFNDMLKLEGGKAVSDVFEPVLTKYTARTLEGYFSKDILAIKLDDNDKSNLAYIEKYSVTQSVIIDAYRRNELTGKLELESTRKGLEMAVNNYNNNKEILSEAGQWGNKDNIIDLTRELIGMDTEESKNHCREIRNSSLNKYFTERMSEFKEQKQSQFELNKLKPVIINKQAVTCEDYNQKEDTSFADLKYIANQALESGAKTKEELVSYLQNTTNAKEAIKSIDIDIENHQINKTIDTFKEEKNNTKDPIDTFNVLTKEQLYLTQLEEKLKYPEHISEKISYAIVAANENQELNTLADLNKLVKFVTEDKLCNDIEIMRCLKEPGNLTNMIKSITTNYQDRYLKDVEQNVNQIENKGVLLVGKQKFSNSVEYLDYTLKECCNEYTPTKELNIMQQKTIDKQIESQHDTETVQEQEHSAKNMDFER